MDQRDSASNSAMTPLSQPERFNKACSKPMPVGHLGRCFPQEQTPCFEDQPAAQVGTGKSKSVITAVQKVLGALPSLTSAPTEISQFLDYREASDEELLSAARSSDECAFAELSDRYRKSIHNTASRIVRHSEDAEDVVQVTLFKAYIHLKHFRGTCQFSTWLTRIAINSALMLLRKRRSRSEVSCDQRGNEDRSSEIWEFPDPSPNPEQIYEKRQALQIVSRAITRLPPAYRSVLTQFQDHEESMQRIADTVGITVGATKSRLRRARLAIRSILEESELRRGRKVLNGRRAPFESGWTG